MMNNNKGKNYKGYSLRRQSSNSYKIIVSHKGKYHYRTWHIPEGLTESKALRELEVEAIRFRDEVKSDLPPINKITFEEYSVKFLQVKKELKKVKETTYSDYEYLISKINAVIGHYYMEDISPQILTNFFLGLTDPSAKEKITVRGNTELREAMAAAGYTQQSLADMCGIAVNTVGVAVNCRKIRIDKALEISKAVKRDLEDIFDVERTHEAYASKTVSSIVKLTGSILEMAHRNDIISSNPFYKVDKPKYIKKEADYLTDQQVIMILEESEKLDIKHRLLLELFVMTGARRGEIDGLTWRRIDFNANTLYIGREITYTTGSGINIVDPKTESGYRSIELPATTMLLLENYREWYAHTLGLDINKLSEGDYYLFFQMRKLPDIVPMNPTSITSYFNDFSRRKDLPHLHPHALRHTYASILIDSGLLTDLELANALGHSSAQITKEIYGHLMRNPASKTANIVSKAFNKVNKS